MVTRELGSLIPTLAFVSLFVLIGMFQAPRCLEVCWLAVVGLEPDGSCSTRLENPF